MEGATTGRRRWPLIATVFVAATVLKLLVLAPNLYHSTDFEVHRNWLAVTYARPLKDWYSEDTSEWTLDYPPLFAYFQWVLSQVAVYVDPDLVTITPLYEPSAAAEWFQRISVMVVDVALVFGVMAWCTGRGVGGGVDGRHTTLLRCTAEQGVTCAAVGSLALLNSALFMVDHIHFQYNGFLVGLLLLSMGLIRHGNVLLGGATFTCLLMLKHLFLALAPLYFVYLLASYCCCYLPPQRQQTSGIGDQCGGGGGRGKEVAGEGSDDGGVGGVVGVQTRGMRARRGGEDARSGLKPGRNKKITSATGGPSNEEAMLLRGLSLKRLGALGSVVVCVVLSALGPLCVSGGWTKETCLEQLAQLGSRLFPFDRGLVHAYWAPNLWALYLFLDRVSLSWLKLLGMMGAAVGKGSTTGGLVRTEIMAVLPSVPAGLCAFLSLLACWPALVKAWKRPSPEVLALGVVHCSLSAFLVGFHVHEKALLVPAVVSALLAFRSVALARAYLRLSFLAAFAAFPLLPGADLRVLKVVLVAAHLTLATSLLEHKLTPPCQRPTAGHWLPATPSDSSAVDGIASPTEDPRRIAPPLRSIPAEGVVLAGQASVVEADPTLSPTDTLRRLAPPPLPNLGEGIVPAGQGGALETGPPLWTVLDKAYVAGACAVFSYGEVFHPWMFREGVLPFLPLMAVSVYGAVGVVACWGLSLVAVSTTPY